MESYLYITIATFAIIFVVGCSSGLILRFLAVRKYGMVPKPDILDQVNKNMTIDDLKSLLGNGLKEVSSFEYIWTSEITNRGLWKMIIKLIEKPAWTDVPFLFWEISFESSETKYLNIKYHLLKP